MACVGRERAVAQVNRLLRWGQIGGTSGRVDPGLFSPDLVS